MPRPPQLDYNVVERFLRGELSLAQLDEGMFCSNATRMLILQAIIIANPDKYLALPFENMILQEGLGDILRETFPKHYASIVVASSRQDLHRSSSRNGAKVKLQIPDKLCALVERYAESTVLSDVMVPILEQREAIDEAALAAQSRTEAQAAHVVDIVRHVLDSCGSNRAQLVAVVRQLRRQCTTQNCDWYTDPARRSNLYSTDLEAAIRRQLRKR